MRKIGAAQFKSTCLALMDRVARTGEPVEVTKRGKALVRVIRVEADLAATRASVFGAAIETFLYVAPHEELLSTGES